MTTTSTARPATYGHDAATATFSVDRYQRMIEAGILTPGDRVELLENYVVLKMPGNPAHDGTIDLIQASLRPLLPSGWLLRCQQTVVFADSQPEPDFAVVRGHPRSFLTRHPAPDDVGLLVEVANVSLLRDQRDKARIYARGGIPHYWIVNLVDRQVEAHSLPSGPTAAPAYAVVQVHRPGEPIVLPLDGIDVATVPADSLLP